MLIGLATVFALMLLKEAGVPIPVPSDVIMLGAAARAATGEWSLPAVIITVEVAMLIGGTTQYLLVRGPGRRLVYRLGRYLGLTPQRLERAATAAQRGGVAAVAVGMATPGVRAATIAASGLANLRAGIFLPALVIGDSVFFLLHVAIGYAGGRGLGAVGKGTNLHSGPILIGILVAVAVAGLIGWTLLRRRARRAGQEGAAPTGIAGAWVEAACPVCLALGAMQERRLQELPAR
jgi:membrane protein DedA with SNARE-associated domain